MTASTPDFLIHDSDDNVAVAVRDLQPGTVRGGHLKENTLFALDLREAVLLGHKFAAAPIAAGGDVVKYGVRIGVATTEIDAGDHVHVHNLRSVRWQTSLA